MQRHIRELRKALLIFHSPVDEMVGIENARQIYETAPHPKSFVCLDGADHMLTQRSGIRRRGDQRLGQPLYREPTSAPARSMILVVCVPPQPFTWGSERKPKPEYEMVGIVP